MNIPKQIKIFGRTYTITLDDNEFFAEVAIGQVIPEAQEIRLVKPGTKNLHHEQCERTLVHEIIHAVLSDMKEEELNDNEVFVNTLAIGFHEIINQFVSFKEEDSYANLPEGKS